MNRVARVSPLDAGHVTADRISVCMATYNGAPYLAQQIDSILAQLCEGDELLVSDDGSTDATHSILEGYGASLRVIGRDRAGGVVANFSRVLMHAHRELVVLADQDDVWLPGHLADIRRVLAEVDLVLTNATVVDEALRPLGPTLFEETGASPGFWRNLLRRNSFVGCCMGFRRDLLAKALPLPPGTPWHDWLIGLLASLGGRVRLVATPSMLYRRHGANVSQTGQRSTNSLLKMAWLRVQMLLALAICLCRWHWRRRSPADGRIAT